MAILINLVIEDEVHLHVLRKIIKQAKSPFEINNTFGLKGNSYIKQNLPHFNHAARFTPYLVLTDLDHIECPPMLIKKWVDFEMHRNLLFRIAVREAEAWLLADRNHLAEFLGVSSSVISRDPESIENPKEYIVRLARKSRLRKIRDALVPKGTATVGKNYNSALAEFINNDWDIDSAQKYSHSLSKLVKVLEQFKME